MTIVLDLTHGLHFVGGCRDENDVIRIPGAPRHEGCVLLWDPDFEPDPEDDDE